MLDKPSLRIVGTRQPTVYGTQMAERMGRELAKRSLAIISGLARGLDAIAQEGATSVGGRAIGVLGTGIDICYPKENKKLYEKVLEGGTIVGEMLRGSHPARENFPVRNRIIAGMPLGVVIVEGKEHSGSRITARLAMEFGREVFGVPGNATQEVSFAVTSAEDVIEALSTPVRAALVRAEVVGSGERKSLMQSGLTIT